MPSNFRSFWYKIRPALSPTKFHINKNQWMKLYTKLIKKKSMNIIFIWNWRMLLFISVVVHHCDTIQEGSSIVPPSKKTAQVPQSFPHCIAPWYWAASSQLCNHRWRSVLEFHPLWMSCPLCYAVFPWVRSFQLRYLERAFFGSHSTVSRRIFYFLRAFGNEDAHISILNPDFNPSGRKGATTQSKRKDHPAFYAHTPSLLALVMLLWTVIMLKMSNSCSISIKEPPYFLQRAGSFCGHSCPFMLILPRRSDKRSSPSLTFLVSRMHLPLLSILHRNEFPFRAVPAPTLDDGDPIFAKLPLTLKFLVRDRGSWNFIRNLCRNAAQSDVLLQIPWPSSHPRTFEIGELFFLAPTLWDVVQPPFFCSAANHRQIDHSESGGFFCYNTTEELTLCFHSLFDLQISQFFHFTVKKVACLAWICLSNRA